MESLLTPFVQLREVVLHRNLRTIIMTRNAWGLRRDQTRSQAHSIGENLSYLTTPDVPRTAGGRQTVRENQADGEPICPVCPVPRGSASPWPHRWDPRRISDTPVVQQLHRRDHPWLRRFEPAGNGRAGQCCSCRFPPPVVRFFRLRVNGANGSWRPRCNRKPPLQWSGQFPEREHSTAAPHPNSASARKYPPGKGRLASNGGRSSMAANRHGGLPQISAALP